MNRGGNFNYQDLRSLAQLRASRENLRWQIASQKELIARDWQGVRDVFSLPGVIRLIFGRYDNLQTLGSLAMDGYSSVMAWLKRRAEEKQAREQERPVETETQKIREKEKTDSGSKTVKTVRKTKKVLKHNE